MVTASLSSSELARLAGSAPDRIDALVSAGVLPAEREGRFLESDIQRVRLAEALDAAGISLSLIGEAIASGHLDFGFVGSALPVPSPLSSATYVEEAPVVGVSPEALLRLYSMWGLPRPCKRPGAGGRSRAVPGVGPNRFPRVDRRGDLAVGSSRYRRVCPPHL